MLIFPGNIENRLRHRRGEKDRLTSLRRNILKNRLDVIAEAHVQHLVRLIEYHRVDRITADRLAAQMIHHASRRSDDNLRTAL